MRPSLVDDRARILTDPLLTGALMHLHRRAGLVPHPPPGLDAVVISHLHMDHLHLPSLAQLDPGTPVLIPQGCGPPAGEARRSNRWRCRPVTSYRLATRPFTSSTLCTTRPDGRGAGCAARPSATSSRVPESTYFAGDTSVFDGMSDLYPGKADVALLPVWGWGPNLRGEHMDPQQAASCLPMIGTDVAIPIHYGTFWPRGMGWVRKRVFHEPGREFAEYARATAPSVDVRVLEVGTSTEVRLPTSRTTT